jgi:hypothetical protein
MITIHDNVFQELSSFFGRACGELDQARRRQRGKDSPAHRAAVTACRQEIDAILDLYLETDPAGARQPDRPTVAA